MADAGERKAVSESNVRRNSVLFLSLAATSAASAAIFPAWAANNYSVRFENAPADFEQKLVLISSLTLEARPYPTMAAIRRAGRADIDPLTKALQAGGYYAADVRFELSIAEGAEGQAEAIFYIEPGPKFRIDDHRVVYSDQQATARPQTFDALGVSVTENSEGAALKANQDNFVAALWRNGYPSARSVGRYADANLAAGAAGAVYTFESGPRAVFGEPEITGAERTDEAYLRKLMTWAPGEQYDKEKLLTYRDRLATTGIFDSIDVAPGAPDESGVARVLVDVSERKRRTIGAGLSFSTAEGPGARLFFEYRNLFGAGETARVELEGTEVQQRVNFNINKPMPTLPGSVFGDLSFINETTDSYDARTVEISGGFSKFWLGDRLETRGGGGFETSKIRQDGNEERTYLFSLPLAAIWDTEEDPLKLEKGVRASFIVTPYTGTDTFTQAELNARSRVNFGADNRFTIAGRTRLGATFGSSLTDLPVNKRYFSGGGASVRGYDFQAVGPLDPDGDPIGGRSVIEAALEARAKVTKNIQLAAFIDAGAVTADSIPDVTGDYLTGVGGGVRYSTPIGPVRLDVAFPLEKRETDRAVQFYISLGQAF